MRCLEFKYLNWFTELYVAELVMYNMVYAVKILLLQGTRSLFSTQSVLGTSQQHDVRFGWLTHVTSPVS